MKKSTTDIKNIHRKFFWYKRLLSLPAAYLPNYKNRKKTYVGGMYLIVASFLANVLNYIFNAYLGRILSFGDFSLIGLIGGFVSVASLFYGAVALAVNYRGSFLIGKYDDNAAWKFLQYMQKRVRIPSIALTVIWLLLIPVLMQFFHTSNVYLFLFFGLMLLVSFTTYVNQGFLSAKMMFGSLGLITLADPVSKLVFTFFLVFLGLNIWTFAAIPFAALVVFILCGILTYNKFAVKKTKAKRSEIEYFSKRFYGISILSGISSVAYFTIDIFLAKHFLSASDAGRYTLVSLVGKMIFFLGKLPSPFVVPLIGRHEGAKKNPLKTMYLLLLFTGILSLTGFILFGLLARFTVPLLYGERAVSIVGYLSYYTFGMLCYTISSIIISYYLVRKIYTFTIAPFFLIIVQIGLLMLFHTSIQSIALVMAVVLILNLVLTLILHFHSTKVMYFEKSLSKKLALSKYIPLSAK